MDQQIGTNSWLCSVTCFGGCLVGVQQDVQWMDRSQS